MKFVAQSVVLFLLALFLTQPAYLCAGCMEHAAMDSSCSSADCCAHIMNDGSVGMRNTPSLPGCSQAAAFQLPARPCASLDAHPAWMTRGDSTWTPSRRVLRIEHDLWRPQTTPDAPASRLAASLHGPGIGHAAASMQVCLQVFRI